MIIYIDIDETICAHDRSDPSVLVDYEHAKPIYENIEVTRKQFENWGVKFHDLKFGKPNYDLFIDDKNMNTRDWV